MRNLEDIYPLSPMQQGILFHSIYQPKSDMYFEQSSWRIEGPLNVHALREAWQCVVDRHSALRTAFLIEGVDEPLQIVYQAVELPFDLHDWRDTPETEVDQRLALFLAGDRERNFELSTAPLMRMALIQLADDVYHLVWSHHHLLFDGWSQPLIFQDFFVSYQSLCRGSRAVLPPTLSYRDYIAWLQKQDLQGAEQFWREYLKGFRVPTRLTVHDPLAAGASTVEPAATYIRHETTLSPELSAALEGLARRYHLTLNTIVQGAWGLLLSRYSREDDVVFGATVSGRPAELPYAEAMVGLFINTLPVRVRVAAGQPVHAWLAQLQSQQAAVRQYEYTPLAEIQRWSGLPANQPLFETLFVFENYPTGDVLQQPLDGLSIRGDQDFTRTNYPLTVAVTPGDRLGIEIAFERDHFDEGSIHRLVGHFEMLLAGMAAHPESPVVSLPLLTGAERQRILVDWNRTESPYPSCGVHELIAEQAARTPDAVAVVFEDGHLTYGELNDRANQIAHYLQSQGIGPEMPVGLCVDRTMELVVAILGILKAGGAYMPLPPDYPDERLAWMLADVGTHLVLSQARFFERLSGIHALNEAHSTVEVVCLDTDWQTIAGYPRENPVIELALDSLAYVIYTSGSTGKPKGTLLRHRGLTNTVTHWGQIVGLTAADRVLQFLSYGFDGSIVELFPPLVTGATLVLTPESVRLSLPDLHRFLQEQAISILTLTPSALALLPADDMPALKTVVAGGERCSRELVDRWGTLRRFVNVYGPTEATVNTALFVLDDGQPDVPVIPIGRPIPNVQVYVLDPYLVPVPVGVPGELYIGGAGVARGYLNRSDWTEAHFVPNPFSTQSGSRLYKSGDLVRYWADGNLEFLGRADDQVKVRGFRVELSEIESVLVEHPAIEAATVVPRETERGVESLVAYVVLCGDAAPDAGALRDYLLGRLPGYMVPSLYVSLETLPLTSSGKVDRVALRKASPTLEDAGAAVTAAYVAPRTPVERGVADIWARVLNVARVSIDDNFFVLGGHSLLATRVISRIREVFSVPLSVSALFDAPTVVELAVRVEEALRLSSGVTLPPIEPRSSYEVSPSEVPLSFSQQRLWFLEQLSPGNLFYNLPIAVRLKGVLDVVALERSLNHVVARHEVLRTTFASIGGRPVQVIAPELWLPLPLVDLPGISETALEMGIRGEARQPFDLERGPLLRVKLLRLAEEEYILLITMHHIITDGWSSAVFVQEVATSYTAFAKGAPLRQLPELPVQYADFALWQRAWLQGERLEQQLDYWKSQLAGATPVLELPLDRPRPVVQTSHGATLNFRLPKTLSDALRALGQEEGATLFMTLLAAFQTLLYRYTGQQDIPVGTPVANRNRVEVENLIGFFVNTLVMRGDLSGDPTFRELLARVRDVALGAYAHQDLPFETLVEALHPQRDMSHTPLFQVMLVLDVPPVEPLTLPDLVLTPIDTHTGTSVFDLTLVIADTLDGFESYFEYNSDLFDRETIQRMTGHFETLLQALVEDPDRSIAKLPILTPEERHEMLVDWHATGAPLRDDTCIHHLFEAQVRARPDAPAVMFEDTVLTYAELNRRANQLAHYLRARGVGPEVLVGLATNRSPEMVVGIVGVLKAGGAYLPLDPTYPPERLAFMIEDSHISTLLTQEHLVEVLPAEAVSRVAPVVLLDTGWSTIAQESTENPEVPVTANHAAYVIYTSGSTGKPKGAVLEHRGLCNLTDVQQRAFHIGEGSRILQFSPLSFDASVWETFMALCNGALLCLARQEVLASGPDLVAFLREARITTVTLPPSLLRVLPVVSLPSLRTVIAAGEACTIELVKRWAPNRRFFNAYGPTETTVCASMYLCDEYEAKAPSIGKAIANCELYVLSEHMEPVPIGVPGELYIGGVNLAREYLNRPELTAERFIASPFEAQSRARATRLYRTGDLVRYRRDGNIEFLGRVDHQVKVRGFRIELGEIEAVLEANPDLRDAAVVVREDVPGDPRLVAYVVPATEVTPTVEDLRAWIRQRLPEYMVPSFFVSLPALPVSPAGKIDRGALRNTLPAPQGSRPELMQDYVAPRTPIEEQLAAIGAELLQIDRIGVYDSFFDLGGHSLLATQFISRVRETFNVEIPLRSLFEHPSIADLAGEIEVASRRGELPPAPAIQRVARSARRIKRPAPVQRESHDFPSGYAGEGVSRTSEFGLARDQEEQA